MKIFATFLYLMLFVLAVAAQEQRTIDMKKAQLNEPVIRKVPVNTLPAPVATPPAPAPAPAANLVTGKDLGIRIKSFQYNPANGGSTQVNYVVRNNGTEALDLNNVTLQGYLDYAPARPTDFAPSWPVNGKNYYVAGGHVIASSATILGPGQEKEGVLNFFNISKDHYFNTTSTYNYMLWLDKTGLINEVNESNNFATYTFRGYQGQYQPAVSSSQYYLTNAYITIRTGSDDKEKLSEVNVRLIPAMSKDLTNTYNEFICKIAKDQQSLFKNSSSTFPLYLFMSSTAQLVNPATSLASFEQNGLGLVIEYKPNFVLDAWKVDQVELTLYFKDANGLFHPTQGVKTIRFNTQSFLDGFAKKFLVCKADNAMNAVSVKTIENLASY
jgi:hypothetical protein